ncbi:MAG TPA: efflux RND transporter periplasmic adaptor subunit [Sedimentisphaerales bacterium]|nr:efflux RND transporter periplasmic adaptor subunit [Sedimentisphaerales bacterium]
MKKSFLLLLVAAVVAMGGWQLYKRAARSGANKRPGRSAVSVAVETKPIRRDVIRDIGVFTGSLEPKAQFIVAPKVAGWLKKLLVDVGDTVDRNQVIAVLDDEEFAQEVEQARAELQVAKANAANCATDLDIAMREYERAKALRQKQIASAAELDVSEAAFNASQTRHKVSLAQLAQKEAALKTAEVRLSYTQVQAFWEEGDQTRVVGERFVDEGALLQVNQSIVSILQNNPLTAVVYVIERDYPKVKVGQDAVVTTDAYPDRAFTGVIVRIAPLLKESSRQARVEVEVPNPDRLLKPGMFVRTQVEFDRHENATLIPLPALVRRNGKEGVFIADLETLKVRFVPVTTGIIDGELVEITQPEISGLVVTLGNHLLEDGSDITLPKKGPQAQHPPQTRIDSSEAHVSADSGDAR